MGPWAQLRACPDLSGLGELGQLSAWHTAPPPRSHPAHLGVAHLFTYWRERADLCPLPGRCAHRASWLSLGSLAGLLRAAGEGRAPPWCPLGGTA